MPYPLCEDVEIVFIATSNSPRASRYTSVSYEREKNTFIKNIRAGYRHFSYRIRSDAQFIGDQIDIEPMVIFCLNDLDFDKKTMKSLIIRALTKNGYLLKQVKRPIAIIVMVSIVSSIV